MLIHSGHYCSDLWSLNGDSEIELEVVFQWDLYLTSLYPLRSIFSAVRLKAGTISSCRISLPKTYLCCQLESNILAIWNKPHNTDCSTYTANTERVCDHKSFATTFAISLAAPNELLKFCFKYFWDPGQMLNYKHSCWRRFWPHAACSGEGQNFRRTGKQ